MYVQTNKDKTTRVAGLPHVLETTLFMASFERSTWLAFRCKLPETIENQRTSGRLLSSSIDVTMIFDVSYRTDENCEPASRHASLSLINVYWRYRGDYHSRQHSYHSCHFTPHVSVMAAVCVADGSCLFFCSEQYSVNIQTHDKGRALSTVFVWFIARRPLLLKRDLQQQTIRRRWT